MDYKRIIKKPETRRKILELLSFIPDKQMLKIQYRIKFGRKVNLEKPVLYSEKIQWYKLNYKDPLMIKCVDKYDVREYLQSKGLANVLNECYGVFDNVTDIDFDNLPNQFVIKDTLGGGSRSVIVVKNKNDIDLDKLRLQLANWLQLPSNRRNLGREWPYYSGKKHRLIIEKYLEGDPSIGLVDYKFFCFNGKPYCLNVVAERDMGQDAGIGIFDLQFNQLPYSRADERALTIDIKKPSNFDKMLEIVRLLSQDFPHVRVDLFSFNESIIFGELTFYPGSGYMKFSSDTFDYILGNQFDLPNTKHN